VALYDELGGDAALDAALDAFYVKILADPRVNGYFDGVDMVRLKGHAKAFLTMAFGGPGQISPRRWKSPRAVEVLCSPADL
jgi:truncated hemoglobin YjbI